MTLNIFRPPMGEAWAKPDVRRALFSQAAIKCTRRLQHQCHGTHRRRRSISHFQGKTNEQEILPNQFVEVTELLDHANPGLQPDEVRWPPPLPRIVHADEVCTKDGDLAVNQPLSRFRRDIRSILREPWLAPISIRAGPADRRRPRSDLLARFPFGAFEITDGDCLAVLLVREIEKMPRKDQLFQGDLLDRCPVLDEMARHVEMGAAVFRHEDHAAFHRELALRDGAEVLECLEWPKGHHAATEVLHSVEVFVAEIDDFPDGCWHERLPS